jgi:crossover junction endodeoxyribonuclease RuvC
MITLGIDIGLTGAVAAVDSRSAVVHDIPTTPDGKGRRIDGRALLVLIREMVPIGESALLLFEDVRARPQGNGGSHGNSMHSQGSMMRSRGIVEAVADITRLKVEVVQPQTWKRHFELLKTEKGESLKRAREMFPLIAADLKRVKDHNRAESLLIAAYGREKFA